MQNLSLRIHNRRRQRLYDEKKFFTRIVVLCLLWINLSFRTTCQRHDEIFRLVFFVLNAFS